MTEPVLSKRQIKKIEIYLRDEAALNRAIAGTITKRTKSNLARQAAQGNSVVMKRAIVHKVRSLGLAEQVKQAVCVGYDWCKKRGERLYNIVTALVVVLLPMFDAMAGAVATVVYIIKHSLFDLFCNCGEPAKVL